MSNSTFRKLSNYPNKQHRILSVMTLWLQVGFLIHYAAAIRQQCDREILQGNERTFIKRDQLQVFTSNRTDRPREFDPAKFCDQIGIIHKHHQDMRFLQAVRGLQQKFEQRLAALQVWQDSIVLSEILDFYEVDVYRTEDCEEVCGRLTRRQSRLTDQLIDTNPYELADTYPLTDKILKGLMESRRLLKSAGLLLEVCLNPQQQDKCKDWIANKLQPFQAVKSQRSLSKVTPNEVVKRVGEFYQSFDAVDESWAPYYTESRSAELLQKLQGCEVVDSDEEGGVKVLVKGWMQAGFSMGAFWIDFKRDAFSVQTDAFSAGYSPTYQVLHLLHGSLWALDKLLRCLTSDNDRDCEDWVLDSAQPNVRGASRAMYHCVFNVGEGVSDGVDREVDHGVEHDSDHAVGHDVDCSRDNWSAPHDLMPPQCIDAKLESLIAESDPGERNAKFKKIIVWVNPDKHGCVGKMKDELDGSKQWPVPCKTWTDAHNRAIECRRSCS